MPKAAEARARHGAAQVQSEEWQKIGLAARRSKFEEYVLEGIRLQCEQNGASRAPLRMVDFEDAAKRHSLAITPEQVLAINARYYELEFVECDLGNDVFCVDPGLCDNRNPRRSDAFNTARLKRAANIVFVDTSEQWNTPRDALDSFHDLVSKVAYHSALGEWPLGFDVNLSKWKTLLPRDRAAPDVFYDNGDGIPPKAFKNVHYSDFADDLRSPLCKLDEAPDFSGMTPSEIRAELTTRMLCNVACIRRNRDAEVSDAMFAAMVERALRSDALFRYLTPLRDLVHDELARRRNLGVASVLVSRIDGANSAEMAEVLLPYIELWEAISLKATCRALRDWCSANGVAPRLAVGEYSPDGESPSLTHLEAHSVCAATGAPEAVRGKMLTAQPVVYYQRQLVRDADRHAWCTHGLLFPSKKIFVNHKNDASTRLTITLVEDNAERTPVVGFGGSSQVSFGAAEHVAICENSAMLKRHELPAIKFAVFARPSKDWGNRRLRARLTLHVACRDAHGLPQKGIALTGDSAPFLVIAREHSASTKLLSKSRDLEKARKRRMSKLSSRMQQSGERRQRAMDRANQ